MTPTNGQENIIFPGQIVMEYKVAVGHAGSRFLTELRDNKKIVALKCPTCNRVYVPPRQTCIKCFRQLDEWVELSGKGTLKTWTVVGYKEPYHPANSPLIYGLIHLDGADTDFLHLIGEVDPARLKTGMKVGPVFKEKGEGNILDIKYFKPI